MNHPKAMYSYVGVDSHKDSHTAFVMNCFFEKLGEITFPNTPSAFPKFLTNLDKYKVEGTAFAFGLEDTSIYGRHLAIFLQNQNILVKHVNAGIVAKERKNLSDGEKTDEIDAYCAARVLLNRFDSLPEADTQDKYWILQGLVTRRRNIIKMNIGLKNHLHSYLTSHYPSYTNFFSSIDKKSALAFYEKYPSPSLLEGVTEAELSDFLSEYAGVSDVVKKAILILTLVREDGNTETEYQEVRNIAVKSTISQIKSNIAELENIDEILRNFMKKFDYQLESMMGVETVTAAELLAEIGDITMFKTPAKLARYCGIAPVSYSSGKKDFKFSTQRGNRTLNSIFYRIALWMVKCSGTKNKKIVNPFFYEYYNRKLGEGKTKRQALKCVQRRLVTIIWGMLTYKTPYINPPMEDYKEESKEEAVSGEVSEKN